MRRFKLTWTLRGVRYAEIVRADSADEASRAFLDKHTLVTSVEVTELV